ncbi:MAG: hypothetical protein K6D56_06380 [Clostridia bacterium]|nr:hypothetical protein [Clostridia bacterium]
MTEQLDKTPKAKSLEELMIETNCRLAGLTHDYTGNLNSVTSIYVDDETRPPAESDIGEKIEDLCAELPDHVDDLLGYCHILNDLVFRDLVKEGEAAAKDECEDEFAARILNARITEAIAELLGKTENEVYRLTKKGKRRYDPRGEYNIFLDLIGIIHFTEPEEYWAVLLAKWTD